MPAITLAEPFQKPTTMLYRNLLAMETEELLRSYPADGCVLMGGCDKTTPALVMGAVSMNLPTIFRSRRADAARRLQGQVPRQRLGHVEILGGAARRQHHRAGLAGDRGWNCALAGPLHDDGDGEHDDQCGRDARPDASRRGLDPGARLAPRADGDLVGKAIVEMVWEDVKPLDYLSAASFDNAVTAVVGLGGSTNSIVHLVAMAKRCGINLTIDRFDEIARRTPVLANLRPSGAYLMEDFYYAGGLRAFLTQLGDLIDGKRPAVQRQDDRGKHRRRRRA
jgi:dihydroxy-acid dehydratase